MADGDKNAPRTDFACAFELVKQMHILGVDASLKEKIADHTISDQDMADIKAVTDPIKTAIPACKDVNTEVGFFGDITHKLEFLSGDISDIEAPMLGVRIGSPDGSHGR